MYSGVVLDFILRTDRQTEVTLQLISTYVYIADGWSLHYVLCCVDKSV